MYITTKGQLPRPAKLFGEHMNDEKDVNSSYPSSPLLLLMWTMRIGVRIVAQIGGVLHRQNSKLRPSGN